MMDSVWSEISLPHYPPLSGEYKADVLVIGGGLAGVLCAYKLHQAGVDCVLIEADRIGRGVSCNTTAKITSLHGLLYHKLIRKYGDERAQLYWQANEDALKQYRDLATQIQCDFEIKDNYIYSRDNVQKLEQEMQALGQLRIPAEYTQELPLPFSVAGAVRFIHQAQFHPLKFLSAVSKDLRIYEQTAAKAFEGNTVITDRGRITASKIIVATHFPIINKYGAYFIKMYQHRSYVLGLKNGPELDGMYLDEANDGFSFRNYGDMLLLGGGSHRTGKQGRGWQDLELFAGKHYPDGRITHRWATQDCMTLDGIPYIGQYSSGSDELYVATGFNKWGMTSSMVAAEVLTDLVQGRKNSYAEVFSPQRSVLHPQLVSNIVSSTVNLLTPATPRCPHLGCALKWNPQEHSWDCPCHGSRFTAEGQLLDNPSTGNLKKEKST